MPTATGGAAVGAAGVKPEPCLPAQTCSEPPPPVEIVKGNDAWSGGPGWVRPARLLKRLTVQTGMMIVAVSCHAFTPAGGDVLHRRSCHTAR